MKRITLTIMCLSVILCGCASLMKDIKDGQFLYNNATSINMDRPNWDEQAGFYMSNYPDCDKNEKAKMLIQNLTNAKENFEVVYKSFRVEQIYIIKNSLILWPPEEVDMKNPGELIGQRMDVFSRGELKRKDESIPLTTEFTVEKRPSATKDIFKELEGD